VESSTKKEEVDCKTKPKKKKKKWASSPRIHAPSSQQSVYGSCETLSERRRVINMTWIYSRCYIFRFSPYGVASYVDCGRDRSIGGWLAEWASFEDRASRYDSRERKRAPTELSFFKRAATEHDVRILDPTAFSWSARSVGTLPNPCLGHPILICETHNRNWTRKLACLNSILLFFFVFVFFELTDRMDRCSLGLFRP
jgi:hypothetical protein